LNRVLFYFLFALLQLQVSGQKQPITGYCSFYADKFHGRHCASGDKYDKNALTAAHRSLPFNTILEVTNIRNNKKVLVRVNDRGPATRKRLLDVSKAAAIQLDMVAYGVEKVRIKILDSLTSAYLLDTLKNTRLDTKPVKKLEKISVKVTPVVEVKNKVEIKNHQVFDKDMNACLLKGYGVQAGYYRIRGNCLAAIAMYEKTYKTKGFFWVEQFTKNTFYHLIMGNFNSKEEAEKLRQQIIKNIPGCFVIEWWKI
jgi:rare lipoprotein A